MIRFMKAEESEKVLNWHFRNIDKTLGGREAYAEKFPAEYHQVINTVSGKDGFISIIHDSTYRDWK